MQAPHEPQGCEGPSFDNPGERCSEPLPPGKERYHTDYCERAARKGRRRDARSKHLNARDQARWRRCNHKAAWARAQARILTDHLLRQPDSPRIPPHALYSHFRKAFGDTPELVWGWQVLLGPGETPLYVLLTFEASDLSKPNRHGEVIPRPDAHFHGSFFRCPDDRVLDKLPDCTRPEKLAKFALLSQKWPILWQLVRMVENKLEGRRERPFAMQIIATPRHTGSTPEFFYRILNTRSWMRGIAIDSSGSHQRRKITKRAGETSSKVSEPNANRHVKAL